MSIKRVIGTSVGALALIGSSLTAAVASPTEVLSQLTTLTPAKTQSSGCTSVHTAYQPTTGKNLVTWIEPHDSTNDIYAQQVDETGAALGSKVKVTNTLAVASWNACEPVTAAAGPNGGWIVVWNKSDDSQIYGATLNSAGEVVGDNFVISSNTNYDDIEAVFASWSRDYQKYLVVWKAFAKTAFPSTLGTQQIVGRFVSASGAGQGSDFLVTDDATQFNNSIDIAYGASFWIVVGQSGNGIYSTGQVVGSSGPTGASFYISDETQRLRRQNGTSITYNSLTGTFMAAMFMDDGAVEGRLLSAAGVPQGSNVVIASTSANANRPRIAPAGAAGYVAVWANNTTHHIEGRVVANDGTMAEAAANLTPSSWSTGRTWRPSVSFSKVSGNAVVTFWGNPLTPNEANVYATSWHVTDPGALEKDGGSGPALRTITFSTSSTVLTQPMRKKLRSLVRRVGTDARFAITGVAGRQASVPYSHVQNLAMKRATVVKAYLVQLGVSKRHITIRTKIVGVGMSAKLRIIATVTS